MWKDSFGRTHLDSVRSVYLIEGANADRLINLFKNKGITLYNVKKRPFSRLIFSISTHQDKKFFAIVKNLCYTTHSSINASQEKTDKKSFTNGQDQVLATKQECGFNVIKKGTVGVGAPITNLLKRLGVIIGVIIFTLSAFLMDDVILDFEFQGSGTVVKRQVENFLLEKGVTKFTRFSSIDTGELSSLILASNSSLSFAQCYKKGNRLIVELVLSTQPSTPIKTDVYTLVSDVDGEIESIKVYRGNPLFSVGDMVKKGDVIVDGTITVNQVTTTTFVLAKVTVKACLTYSCLLDSDSKDLALAYALAQVGDRQLLATNVTKMEQGDKFLYQVDIYYRHVLTVG